MRLLLDTHYLIWMILDPQIIHERERAVIGDPAFEIMVSAITIFELRIKWQTFNARGERKGTLAPEIGVRFCQDRQIALAPLTAAATAETLEVATAHRDPFDEMLLAHAQHIGARLMTRDRVLAKHPLAFSA